MKVITGKIVSFERLGKDERRLVSHLLRGVQRGGDSADVVPVHDRRVPAEAIGTLFVQLYS